jgi:hypothetical protein
MHVATRLYQVFLALLLLPLCSTLNAAEALVDPHLRTDEQVGIFWIDNDRILFRGFASEVLQKIEDGTLATKEMYQTPRAIRSLNVRTREIKEHALSVGGGLCFSNGRVLYSRRDETSPRPYYVFGPLEGEQKASDLTIAIEKQGITSFIRCYNPDKSSFPQWPSQIVPLLEEHGFIELRYKKTERGIRGDEAEIFLYKKGESTGLLIKGYRAIHAANLANNLPEFVPWKGAYFNYTVGVRNSLPNSGWWLYPDGTTEKIDIPFGPWNDFPRTNASFHPTKCGLLINITYRVGELLLLQGDLATPPSKFLDVIRSRLSGVEKVSPGRVWRLAVSPDGLKVAIVAGATAIPNTNPSILRIIDICKG